MAELDTSSGGKGGKKGKKLSTRVDLTPMVDLGFLLITFFIFTTTMAKPKAMEITLPSDEIVDSTDRTKAKAYVTLTLLLSKENRVYYYKGIGDDPLNPPELKLAYFKPQDGVRQVIIDHVKDVNEYKQQYAGRKTGVLASDSPTIIIKPDSNSTYLDLVNALDEMQINKIKKKALVDISDVERDFIKKTEDSNQ